MRVEAWLVGTLCVDSTDPFSTCMFLRYPASVQGDAAGAKIFIQPHNHTVAPGRWRRASA
jgi:hypothetical protein